MPGQITINTVAQVWTEFIKALLPVADQVNAATNDGFSAEYDPEGHILANSCSTTISEQARLKVFCHPDQDAETHQLIKDALEEFHTNHPKGLELIGKIMRGEIPEQPGVEGADKWRTTFVGSNYNAGDGEGSFTVTAPE